MRTSSRENGFTIVEFLIIVVCMGILITTAIPNYAKSKDEARESEVMANLHVIQAAIERFAVDKEYYPAFLLGGDPKGWDHWHKVHDEISPPTDAPSNNLVQDILIQYHYLDSYPQNPFVTDGMQIIRSTTSEGSGPAGIIQPGDGDPRFGYFGTTMGNGLSDPNFYLHRVVGIPPVETPLIETRRTLSESTIKELGFLEPPDGFHYMMGGRKAFDKYGNVITVATWWPGNFFYRGTWCRMHTKHKGWGDPYAGTIPGQEMKKTNYILGCYGSYSTAGQDIIRLEGRNWDNTDDCYYRLPPPWFKNARSSGIKCGYSIVGPARSIGEGTGLPEVFGGGDAFTGPYYPYWRGDDEEGYSYGEIVYGAPDGHPDGVILVLTDSGNISEKF